MKGWVGFIGWLHTVTHLDTNQVWCSATMLIEANALPLSQTASGSHVGLYIMSSAIAPVNIAMC